MESPLKGHWQCLRTGGRANDLSAWRSRGVGAREGGTGSPRTSGAGSFAYKQLGTTYPELYYRSFFDLISNSTTVTLLRFGTSAGAQILTVGVNTSHKLFTTNATTRKTVVGSSVTIGVWHELQVHAFVN